MRFRIWMCRDIHLMLPGGRGGVKKINTAELPVFPSYRLYQITGLQIYEKTAKVFIVLMIN